MGMKISTDERFLSCLEYLAQKFNGKIRHTLNRYYLNLKTKTDNFQLYDSIINQIVTTMKGFYLQNKLKIVN